LITSKDVFAKRREGEVDEAYRMALELMGYPSAGDWDKKAFCWCLIDIIKRDAGNGDNEKLTHYREQLESIEADPSDEVLAKGIRNALNLCNPNGREIIQAKALGKEGRHAEAAAVYRRVLATSKGDRETWMSFGWELYRHSKQLMAVENVNLGVVKRNLNDYLKLDVEKPSLLHSCILQLAAKLAGNSKFSMLVFSRLWNLDNLRPEDFERFRTEDGKEYPSLAEKVIQQVGKEAAASDNTQEQENVLPHLDAAIERFPDNVWLKLDKAKVLVSLGMHDEALAFGLAVAKTKPNDYWAWGLLGDIVALSDDEAALGCYSRALSCPAEEKFRGKIRLKVARRMLDSNDLSAAKLEVQTVIHAKENEGQKIPKEAIYIASQSWFAETVAAKSNREFYNFKIPAADTLIFGSMPWIEACIGEKFTVLDKEGRRKEKRKIFLKTSSVAVEANIPASRFGNRAWSEGDAIKVKGEFEDGKKFKLYMLETRNSTKQWDVFTETIGVVDHINREKGVLHFIVNRETDGIIPLSTLRDTFSEGDSIALWLSKYTSKNSTGHSVHFAEASDKPPSLNVKKEFSEEVRISNGMGFTDNEIFIAPPLVSNYQISDGQRVSGTAILSFNKKRGDWGWRAVLISNKEDVPQGFSNLWYRER
jgi:tetratricopeptide (TPR) repeat protein